jgi:hypothetical protein
VLVTSEQSIDNAIPASLQLYIKLLPAGRGHRGPVQGT